MNSKIDPGKTDLAKFKSNVYSQFGEDGIIDETLKRLGVAVSLDQWCVEFGAWDGMLLSNTYNLIANKNYNAVLIEGDRDKYYDLVKNIPREGVVKICQFVGFDGPNSLENILSKTAIPSDFDFLSIDIDGCDYFILESLSAYCPKLICIEFNPTIPNEVDYVQAKDFAVKQGASIKALGRLGERKGYAMIASTHNNLFLVRNDLLTAVLPHKIIDFAVLRDDSDCKTFLFAGYDGTVLSNRVSLIVPWHGVELKTDRIQVLPYALRKYPSDYNILQRLLFGLWLALREPKLLLRHMQRYLC